MRALLALPLLFGLLVARGWQGWRDRRSVPAVEPPSCPIRVQRVFSSGPLLECEESGKARDGDRLEESREPVRMAGPALRLLGLPIDLNTATVEDLEALPGIGPKLAEAIAAGRPYRSAAGLLHVPGIGEKRWGALRSAVVVDGR